MTMTTLPPVGTLLSPYPYMGCIGDKEEDIMEHLSKHRPPFNEDLATSTGLMPVFYITQKGVDHMTEKGELPLEMLVVPDPNRKTRSNKAIKKGWLEAAKVIIDLLHQRGIEVGWSGQMCRPFWVSAYRHREHLYASSSDSLSPALLEALELEATEHGCPPDVLEVWKEIMLEYSKHTSLYYFPYTKIEKLYNVETIYHLKWDMVIDILRRVKNGEISIPCPSSPPPVS